MNINDFYKFDVELFLKSRNKWISEKEKLNKKLESISELPSKNNESGVRSSDISDPTARQAQTIIGIKEDIENIEELETKYREIKESLDEDEIELLCGFFNPKEPIWKFVRRYGIKNDIGTVWVYEKRRKLLEKIANIIEEG